MSDSGRQIGDCEHAETRSQCRKCLQAKVASLTAALAQAQQEKDELAHRLASTAVQCYEAQQALEAVREHYGDFPADWNTVYSNAKSEAARTALLEAAEDFERTKPRFIRFDRNEVTAWLAARAGAQP